MPSLPGQEQPQEQPESLRARAERTVRFHLTDDPVLLALFEGRDLVGVTVPPQDVYKMLVTYTNAVRLALLDLAEQLDTLVERDIESE